MTEAIPFPRILMGPGPSSVSPRVLKALGREPIGYLDPELFTLLEDLRAGLRIVFGTRNEFTIPLTGTGMAGMESCLANLVEPGDRVVIGVSGFFGGRMVEIARRLGAEVTEVHAEWGRILDPDQFRKALEPLRLVKLVACVHAETSTGIRQPLKEIAEIARAHEALFLVDAVTSLGGLPVEIDNVGIDACYSGTQKCLGAPPGLSPITVSERGRQAATGRNTPVRPWYFDWALLKAYYDESHSYHHTVPVNMLYALAEALQEIRDETLPARFERHREVSDLLMAGLTDLGLTPFSQEGYRLPMLNAVSLTPSSADEAAIRRRLLAEHGIEIGGGLGQLKGRIWRIGTMGASATKSNVERLLGALKAVLA